jgi:tetraacyldisaccharide 4'-kinase
VNAARRWLFENSAIPRKRYPCRVISVGNLEAGGTGKTPLVAWLAREAVARGLRVWILTRGYRSLAERRGGVIEPGPKEAEPALFGDEAALVHTLVPEAWIGVGASRKMSYRRLLKKAGQPPDWVLLDDGFQQLGIEKDFEILALTSRGPKEAPFREFLSQARRASLRVWTKGDTAPPAGYDARVRYRNELPLGWKKGDPVSILSGLGDPIAFRSALEQLGLEVQAERALADHAEFSDSLLNEVADEARRRGWKLAVSGKDAVKLRGRSELQGVMLGVFEPKLEWVEGQEKAMRLLWNS